MSKTINREYVLPTGQLEDDFEIITDNFKKIDTDVQELHTKLENSETDLKKELKDEMSESFALMANLSLYNLERTQKIRIGVEV